MAGLDQMLDDAAAAENEDPCGCLAYEHDENAGDSPDVMNPEETCTCGHVLDEHLDDGLGDCTAVL
jgi:hypothetical protein